MPGAAQLEVGRLAAGAALTARAQLKIGGKKVLPPRVNGQGVTSKQMCRAPPLGRLLVALPAAHARPLADTEASSKPGQFLPLPKLHAAEKGMEEEERCKEDVAEDLLDALREAAGEKLKIYRKV
eukprot:763990-Hanusia_phi.AAC.4